MEKNIFCQEKKVLDLPGFLKSRGIRILGELVLFVPMYFVFFWTNAVAQCFP